jgi:DNA invertase Pin-like site-specific DNA recombinase
MSDPLEDLDHLLLGHGNLLSMADPEQERREATRELDAAVGRLNAAMLRASDAGMSAGAVAKATGLSVRLVYRIVRLQRKGKP